jgi:branched-chain amino acid aminotransferase
MSTLAAYICFNGEILPSVSFSLSPENRAFRYGDAVFETIRCFGNRPMFLELHYKRLVKAMKVMQMNTSCIPFPDILEKRIESLINRNKFFVSSRIRLTVFRNDGGFYTPTTHQCSYLIEASPLSEPSYQLNEKGMIAGVYPEMTKSKNVLSQFKTANALISVMAGLYKLQNNLGECLIINTDGKIVEAISSNLFWYRNEVLYTPSVSSGCVDGVMKNIVMELAQNLNLKVLETQGVDEHVLMTSDEIFVTNAIQGIQWIVGMGDKRYYNQKAKQLMLGLNSLIS